MAVLPIITAPDPRLKIVSDKVDDVDDSIRKLLDDMLETMYAAPGVGLSAVQVGIPKTVMVADCADDRTKPEPLFLVNPEITSLSEDLALYNEGCLSFPEQYADVERPETVTVAYLDYNGDRQTLTADGLLSRCIQHEMDHFKGILFVDYLSKMKRDMIIRRLTKKRRQSA